MAVNSLFVLMCHYTHYVRVYPLGGVWVNQQPQFAVRVCDTTFVTLKFGLQVIEKGTIRKLGYGFLFAFHSNYGSNLYHF